MEYRTNKRTGDRISVIGLGTSYIAETEEKEAIRALEYAYENGVNYADLATADAKTFSYISKTPPLKTAHLIQRMRSGMGKT